MQLTNGQTDGRTDGHITTANGENQVFARASVIIELKALLRGCASDVPPLGFPLVHALVVVIIRQALSSSSNICTPSFIIGLT